MVKSSRRVQYYLRKDEKDVSGTYLPKAELSTIMIHLQKAYDSKIYKLIQKEIAGIERFLKSTSEIPKQIQAVYASYPEEIKEMIHPIDMDEEELKKKWEAVKYEGKEISRVKTYWETDRGELVRSKSELTIANTLAKHKIPYRYEYPLQLKNGSVIYPDFTIYNSKKRKVIYWEHRGMMDDRDYARNAVSRLKDLSKNGIVLGDNLFLTEETSTSPLGTDEIEKIIQLIQS